MVEALDRSEEARRGLLQEVAALRKQSVFALILALLFILMTVYLYFQVKQSKAKLEQTNKSLRASEEKLAAQNKKIQAMNAELDSVRQQYLRENLPSPSIPPPDEPAESIKYTKRSVTKSGFRQSFFGYIIYIQDRQGSNVSVALQRVLKEKGAIVPAIEHMSDRVKFSNAVKYFHPEDKAMAYNLQKLMLSTPELKAKSYTADQLPVQFIASKKVPLGQLEVWIDS